MLVHEDLVQDTTKCARVMAQFMNLADGNNNNQDLIAKVETMSAKTHMTKQHTSKFDEPHERPSTLGHVGDLSQLAPGAKVMVQTHPQVLNAKAHTFLEEKWKQSVAPLLCENVKPFAKRIEPYDSSTTISGILARVLALVQCCCV